MPLPTPRPEEQQSDFVSRCMGNDESASSLFLWFILIFSFLHARADSETGIVNFRDNNRYEACVGFPQDLCNGIVGTTLVQLGSRAYQVDASNPKTWRYEWDFYCATSVCDQYLVFSAPNTCPTVVSLSANDPESPVVPFGGLLNAPDSMTCLLEGQVGSFDILARTTAPYVGMRRVTLESSCAPHYLLVRATGSPGNPLTSFGTARGVVTGPYCKEQDPQAVDTDGDGRDDLVDNCRLRANGPIVPDPGGFVQRDTDGDGMGNYCDPDLDQSGIVDAADQDLFVADFGKVGPGLHADFDGDGAVNYTDMAILANFLGLAPGPGVNPYDFREIQ